MHKPYLIDIKTNQVGQQNESGKHKIRLHLIQTEHSSPMKYFFHFNIDRLWKKISAEIKQQILPGISIRAESANNIPFPQHKQQTNKFSQL